MPAIVWSDDYSINAKEMDEQHKKLADIINKFDYAVHEKKEQTIIKKTLEDLLDYTETHFTREEELLRQHNFPEYDSHKEDHNRLTEEVAAMYSKYIKGDKNTDTKNCLSSR